jgi:alkanesulfonate monooxygenase SsuD/methylene tetrahydromethanopterin reductase-like flavin-dependent oxidoreductase (luciferase family)
MPIYTIDKDYKKTLSEDREAFLLADRLGFSEAYCGEHVTDSAENITSSALFIASLAAETKNIRLGTGTVNMPNSYPAAIAGQVAILDHMLDERFNFGISPGGLDSDAEVFGNLDKNRNEMFVESIDMVLEIWKRDPPYNIKGKYWNISTEQTQMTEIGQCIMQKPMKNPYPRIICTVVAPFSKGLIAATASGWHPISTNFLMPKWIKIHWPKYIKMLFLVNKKIKKTFRWAKLHIKNQKYMNRLLSLNNWDNPSMASPFVII